MGFFPNCFCNDVRLEGQIITRNRDPVLTLGLKKRSVSVAQRTKGKEQRKVVLLWLRAPF